MIRNYIDKIYNLDSLTDEEIKTIESFTEKEKMLLINSYNKSISNANVYILNTFDDLIIDDNKNKKNNKKYNSENDNSENDNSENDNSENDNSENDNSENDNSNIPFSNFIKEKVNSTILQKIWNAISSLCKKPEEEKKGEGGGLALHMRGIIDKRKRERFESSMIFH
jgi:hypothetical protein